MLPMEPGLAGRCTHGYTRHGTTTLFAAALSSRSGRSRRTLSQVYAKLGVRSRAELARTYRTESEVAAEQSRGESTIPG